MANLIYLACISIAVIALMKLGHNLKFQTTATRFAYILCIGIFVYAPYYQLAIDNTFDLYITSMDFSEFPGVNLSAILFMIFISRYLPTNNPDR